MKTNSYRKTLKITSLALAVILLAVLVGSTVAWFVQSRKVTIKTEDDVKIAVEVENLDISVSTDGGLSYTDFTSGQSFSAGASLADITGDGSKLYYPNYLENQDQAPKMLLAYLDISTSLTPEKYVVTAKLKFRTKAKMDVYLSEGSSVLPVGFTVESDGSHKWDGKSQKSKYGNFSVGGIAGAARVAFLTVDENEVETVQNVWVPNPDYALDTKEKTFSITSDPTKREHFNNTDYPYGYIKLGTEEPEFIPYVWDDYASGKVTVGRAGLAGSGMVNYSKKLLSFEESTEYVEKELLVRIWIEGTDREAHYFFNGGQMGYNLTFVGIEKDPCKFEVANKIRYDKNYGKLYYNDGTGEKTCESLTDRTFLYSINGIDWTVWNGNPIEGINENTDIFVRIAETENNYPSEVVKIRPTIAG